MLFGSVQALDGRDCRFPPREGVKAGEVRDRPHAGRLDVELAGRVSVSFDDERSAKAQRRTPIRRSPGQLTNEIGVAVRGLEDLLQGGNELELAGEMAEVDRDRRADET